MLLQRTHYCLLFFIALISSYTLTGQTEKDWIPELIELTEYNEVVPLPYDSLFYVTWEMIQNHHDAKTIKANLEKGKIKWIDKETNENYFYDFLSIQNTFYSKNIGSTSDFMKLYNQIKLKKEYYDLNVYILSSILNYNNSLEEYEKEVLSLLKNDFPPKHFIDKARYNINVLERYYEDGSSSSKLEFEKISKILESTYFSITETGKHNFQNKSILYFLIISNIRKGYAYEYMGDYELSVESFRSALKLSRDLEPYSHLIRESKFNLSYSLYYKNEFEQAENLANDILTNLPKEYLDHNANYQFQAYNAYSLLGDIRKEEYDFENAITYYEKALYYSNDLRSKNLQFLYEGLGLGHYDLGNYKLAINYYEKAYAIPEKMTKDKLNYLLGIADSYFHLDKNKAKELYQTALGHTQKLSETHQNYSKTRIYYKLGMIAKHNQLPSQDYLLMARNSSSLTKYHIPESVDNTVELARSYIDNKKLYLQYMNEAAQYCMKSDIFKESNSSKHNKVHYPIRLIKIYQSLSNYYADKDTESSLEYLEKAATVIHLTKSSYKFKGSKKVLTENSLPTFNRIIELCEKKFRESNESIYLEKAFNAAEKSKSIALLESINQNKAFQIANIPHELLNEERQLRTVMATLEEELKESSDYSDEEIEIIKNDLLESNTAYYALLQKLENDYPRYFEIKYQNKVIKIKDIQKVIDNNEVLIEYHFIKNKLFIFSISKDKYKFFKKDIQQINLNEIIEDFQKEIYDLDDKVSSNDLHNILLEEILLEYPNAKKYNIIPDGILNYLSFEILQETKQNNSEILRNKSVIYNYAASQLFNQENISKKDPQLLGLAPEYLSKSFSPLPYAEREIEKIQHIFHGKNLIRKNANIKLFKKELSNHSLLHIAGHTEINRDFPFQSRLVFTETDSLHQDSFSFYAYELYNMKTNLDMVTLSACNAGIGKLQSGEGSMSLARGFAYAGCPTTTTTLWPMTDRPTMDIMQRYYTNLKKGWKKSAALRSAKLDFLAESGPKAQHPYLWGGIVIIGSDSPIYQLPFYKQTSFFVAIIALLLFGIVSYFMFRKKK